MDDVIHMIRIGHPTPRHIRHHAHVSSDPRLGQPERIARCGAWIGYRYAGRRVRRGLGFCDGRGAHIPGCQHGGRSLKKFDGPDLFFNGRGGTGRWGTRAALLVCLAGLVLLPGRAWAEEMPLHRLDFEADRSLPACNQRGDFIAALTSWVRLGVLDPEASRVLEVRVRRLAEGGNRSRFRSRLRSRFRSHSRFRLRRPCRSGFSWGPGSGPS